MAHFPAILLGWPACDSALRADPDRDVGGLQGLVYGLTQLPEETGISWYCKPAPVAVLVIVVLLLLNFWFR